MNDNIMNTIQFSAVDKKSNEIKIILSTVCDALREKGYDPVNQIVGYILSDDPTYITGHNNARSLIRKVERDELLEEVIKSYLESLKR